MRAVNVKTPAVMCRECISSIEVAVASMPGVIGVTAEVTREAIQALGDAGRSLNIPLVVSGERYLSTGLFATEGA